MTGTAPVGTAASPPMAAARNKEADQQESELVAERSTKISAGERGGRSRISVKRNDWLALKSVYPEPDRIGKAGVEASTKGATKSTKLVVLCASNHYCGQETLARVCCANSYYEVPYTQRLEKTFCNRNSVHQTCERNVPFEPDNKLVDLSRKHRVLDRRLSA